uniref:Bacteriophage protein n=1 Tax=Caulobacter sp. (strain K31) TaxID=366602 RepID=B0T642_CAUSK
MANLNLLAYDGLLEFVLVDLSVWGKPIYRFVNSALERELTEETVPAFDEPISWGGHNWTPLPFESNGWKKSSDGDKNGPSITVPDFQGVLFAQLSDIGGAPGAPIYRYQAFAQNVMTALPGAPFATESYVLKNIKSDGRKLVLELATQMDFTGAKFPAFTMTRRHYPGLGAGLLR